MKKQKPVSKAHANDLPRRLETLQKRQKRLRQEMKQVKAERDQYRKSFLAMMHKHEPLDIPINKKKLLALVGKQPPWRELLAELEAEGD